MTNTLLSELSGTALGDYGHPVFARDGFTCVYCGFDGNGFSHWRQLTVDHVRPKSSGGADTADNLVTACHFCNATLSRLKFPAGLSYGEILELKKERVRERLPAFLRFWSAEVAPRDDVLTPLQGGAYLPHPLILDLSSLNLSDRQLEKISADNGDLRLELTAQGELEIMPPADPLTGWQEGRLYYQITTWADRDGAGVTFSSAAGFRLPGRAVRAPDVSWMPRERWETWLKGQASKLKSERESFSVCPDFVVELRSSSDTLVSLQRKMEEYIANGIRLGWLLDPVQKRAHIYRPGSAPEILENPATVSGEPELPGLELDLRELW